MISCAVERAVASILERVRDTDSEVRSRPAVSLLKSQSCDLLTGLRLAAGVEGLRSDESLG